MEKEQLLAMDPFILLSWTNTKLRDEYSSLQLLCEDFNLDNDEFSNKLKALGYSYNSDSNQFIRL
jgi:hypothetical protein